MPMVHMWEWSLFAVTVHKRMHWKLTAYWWICYCFAEYLDLLNADDKPLQIKSTIEYSVNNFVYSVLLIRWNLKVLSFAGCVGLVMINSIRINVLQFEREIIFILLLTINIFTISHHMSIVCDNFRVKEKNRISIFFFVQFFSYLKFAMN